MKIEYLGHACFRINDCLVIDPYKDGSVPGLLPLRVSAVKVICTHEHADHSGRECVELVPGECGLKISEVASFHDDSRGALRGPNTIFVINSDSGEKLVHLGDLGHFPDEKQLAAISDADYLLIPVGGYYTIDAKMAVKICKAARPKCIIPMHYRTLNSGYPELAEVSEFVRLCEEAGIRDEMDVMAENSTTSITNAKNPQTYNENVDCAKEGGNIAKNAREQLEAKTGKKVVSELNAGEIQRQKL